MLSSLQYVIFTLVHQVLFKPLDKFANVNKYYNTTTSKLDLQ